MKALQRRPADEGEVNGADAGTPHEKDNAAEVQLVTESRGLRIPIPYDVAAERQRLFRTTSGLHGTYLAEQAKQTATPAKYNMKTITSVGSAASVAA